MSDSLDVCILSPGMPHHGGTLAEKSLGGSETAAINVAKALAKRGHFVTVFSPGHEGGAWDGVTYLPIERAPQYLSGTPHDVTVVSRAMDACRMKFASKVGILWLHDLALKRQRTAIGGILWNLDALYVLSEFQKRQYLEVYEGIPESQLFVTRNGIDLESFAALREMPRDRNKLVYGSRPERGLENCLAIMELLAKRGSPLTLSVAWYDNTLPHMQGYYEHLWQRARAMPNVRLLGPLAQGAWHQELASARALIYPGVQSDFREISGIVFMEAQACGTPVVSCAKGAIVETLRADAGLRIGDEHADVVTDAYRAEFAAGIQLVAENDTVWETMHGGGLQHAASLSWDGVAEQWEADWLRRLAERASNPWRLRAHLLRSGDAEAAGAA